MSDCKENERMKQEDRYKHFKGTIYLSKGVALALRVANMSPDILERMTFKRTVRHHENKYDLNLYSIGDLLFIDSEYPFVIYQSELDQEDKVWAREIDSFFGYKREKDNKITERFELLPSL